MSVPAAYRLSGISSKAYEHPLDQAATAALRSIPIIDVAARARFMAIVREASESAVSMGQKAAGQVQDWLRTEGS